MNLIELAERCEAATAEQQADLIADALRVVNGRSLVAREINLLHDGGYVDAAFTLVPDGWWISSLGQNLHGEITHCTLYNDFPTPLADCKRANTPALAICAAALRARASDKERE